MTTRREMLAGLAAAPIGAAAIPRSWMPKCGNSVEAYAVVIRTPQGEFVMCKPQVDNRSLNQARLYALKQEAEVELNDMCTVDLWPEEQWKKLRVAKVRITIEEEAS